MLINDKPETRRSAEVFYDPNVGRLTVRLHMDDSEGPRGFWVSGVDVQLTYPEGSDNYGERHFVRPSLAAR